MKYFQYRTSDTLAIASVAFALLLLATQIDNDILATAIAAVAVIGALVASCIVQKPIGRQDRR
jgi:hypothetical protein